MSQIEKEYTATPGMASVIATVTTFVCSVCDKAFGNYTSCAKHTASGKANRCRAAGASVVLVPNIVGRHDRNVGGRHAHAPGPARIPQDDRDADMSDPDDGAGGTEAEAGQLEPESEQG